MFFFFWLGKNPIFLSPSILAFQISLFLSNRFFSLFLNISSQYYLLRQLESSEGPYLFFFPLQHIISFQTFGLAFVVKGEKYMFLYISSPGKTSTISHCNQLSYMNLDENLFIKNPELLRQSQLLQIMDIDLG